MKIQVLCPGSDPSYIELVMTTYKQYKLSNASIEVIHLPEGPKEIISEADDAIVAPDVIKSAILAEKEGFDGFVVYCFDDPGVRAARNIVKMPIVGLGNPSLTLAHFVSHRFSVLSPGVKPHHTRAYVEHQCYELGLSAKLASVRHVDLPPLAMMAGREGSLQLALQREIKCAVEEDGADTIVFGCGAMTGILETLENPYGATLIDPGLTALNYLELLLNLGVNHSRLLFPS